MVHKKLSTIDFWSYQLLFFTKKRYNLCMKGGQFWKGKKFSDKHKHKLSISHIGKSLKNGENMNIMFKRIENEVLKLEKQGFKCIPLTKTIPDIIAMKDSKIYAIEVEYGKPNYSKYDKNNYKNNFDDIIWILKRSR